MNPQPAGDPLRTPLVLLAYNRPELTRKTLATIRQARPERLFFVVDGPREHRADDPRRVAATRDLLAEIDWPCDVRTNFADSNLGCKRRVASGLDWVFRQVDEAIVLEDDCLPSPSFFPFCERLLARYRDDERVWTIGGVNFQRGPRSLGDPSYYFSRYFRCWGWATWRRSWERFDLDLNAWPEWRDQQLRRTFATARERRYWRKILDAEHAGQIDSWAYAFLFASFLGSGLHALPRINLVSNVGFGDDATHTAQTSHGMAARPTGLLESLRPPSEVAADEEADRRTFEREYLGYRRTRWQRALEAAKRAAAPLERLRREVRRRRRRNGLRRSLSAAPSPRLVIGAAGIAQPGWIATDRDQLDLLQPESWAELLQPGSVDAMVAEHVWEHLSLDDGRRAAETCWRFLRPGGRLRIAVPDGWHPDPAYRDFARPQGLAPGADDHRVLYTLPTLRTMLEGVGYVVRPLEHFDERGEWHETAWSSDDGHIRRSRRFDPRNESGSLRRVTSLIVDAFKPGTAVAARAA